MDLHVCATGEAAALAAADDVARHLQSAIAERGRATVAFSGGKSPGPMLAALARAHVRWDVVDILQVDERIAPDGDADRNATGLRHTLLDPAGVPAGRVHLMPVERSDPAAAALDYGELIERLAGNPPRIDVIHLGLGADGHTASLVPGDPVLEERHALVGLAGPYQGRRRMTVTYPVLAGARRLVWLVTGADKADALRRLRGADASIPAGRVAGGRAVVFADPGAGSWYDGHRP